MAGGIHWVLAALVTAPVACGGGSTPNARGKDAAAAPPAVVVDAAPPAGDPLFPDVSSAKADVFADLPPTIALAPDPTKPKPENLRFAQHPHCELGAAGMACSKGPTRARGWHWKVGRAAGVTWAQRFYGRRAAGELVLRRDSSGALVEVVALRHDGTVDWWRSYRESGSVYTERAASGKNLLRGCGAIRVTMGPLGRASKTTCVRHDGTPMLDIRGVTSEILERDATGLVTRRRHTNRAGAAVANRRGAAEIRVKRDAAGRPTRRQLRGMANATTALGVCSQERIAYDNAGNERERQCLDASGAPGSALAAPVTRYTHNTSGCRIREVYLSNARAPVVRGGVHAIVLGVDRQCRTTSRRCLDLSNKAVACAAGEPAEVRFAWSSAGNLWRTRHYDAAGKPATDPEMRVFERRFTHDATSNRVESSCWNDDGAPVECGRTGYHAAASRFDSSGLVTSETFLDTERKPSSNLGAFERKRRYDAYGHVVEIETLDAAGAKAEILGVTTKRLIYDASHRLVGFVLYDRTGGPARGRSCDSGRSCPGLPWHAMRVIRDERGRAVRNLYFDHQRALIFAYECSRARCWGESDR